MRNNRKGFTIVELVIVIAVIAILAGVLIPTFAGVTKKANESKALQEAKNAYTADLALLNGQVEEDAKGTYYVKTTDTAVVADKDYYTKAENEYTKVTSPAVDNIGTYYEVEYTLAGEFDVEGDAYTYKYEKDGYTCTYANGAWTIAD